MIQIIEQLRNEWNNGTWVPENSEPWKGGDLTVSDHPIVSGNTVVVTKYAGEVSSLIMELKERLKDYLNWENKIAFYPSIGEAANRAIAEYGDSPDAIFTEMLDAAVRFANEWDRFLYFAYGSNMDEGQMLSRCPGAILTGKARVTGHKFVIDNRGVGTILPCENCDAEGLLWIVTKRHISSLDRYEGVAGGYYRKEILSVETEEGIFRALVYLSNTDCNHPGHRAGYVKKVMKAAQDHSLSADAISQIRAFL